MATRPSFWSIGLAECECQPGVAGQPGAFRVYADKREGKQGTGQISRVGTPTSNRDLGKHGLADRLDREVSVPIVRRDEPPERNAAWLPRKDTKKQYVN